MKGRLRLPRALVVVQIGLSFTVLVAAGLLGRSLSNLKSMDIGFDRENLIYASVNPWSAGYKPEQLGPYVERVRGRLASLPGVLRVAVIQQRPLSGSASITILNVPGRTYTERDEDGVLVNNVSDGLFETLRIPLFAGRTFGPADMRKDSDALIVDDSLARRFYPNQNPLGQQIGTGPRPEEQYRIVGVVKSSRHNTLRQAMRPAMYRPSPTASDAGSDINFVLRAAIDTRRLATSIRRTLSEVDANVPVVEIKTQTALIDHLLLVERLLSILSSAFGVLAMGLSAVGLIGLLGYTVARRTNEIGVRMALGASQTDVVRLVLKDSLKLLTAGFVIGSQEPFWSGDCWKARFSISMRAIQLRPGYRSGSWAPWRQRRPGYLRVEPQESTR